MTPARPLLALSALTLAGWAQAQEPSASAHDALRERLAAIAAPLAANARVSMEVQSLDSGERLFSQNGEELLNIASNTKLFTAAAALATLGPDYQFTTEFYVDALRKGKAGTLFVRGKGDPSMTTERLYGIASELLHAGLREVSGDLVLDESWFDGVRTPKGFDQEDTDHPYMAPTGALSLNANAIGLYLRPTRPGAKPVVDVDPPSDYVKLDTSRLVGRCAQPDLSVRSTPEGEHQEQQLLTVSGCLVDPRAGARVFKKIDHPAYYFGQTFKAVLKERGITVKGKVRLGAAPSDTAPLFVAESESLADVLKKVNKRSLNFAAETLLKAMAAEKVGTPATFQAGLEVVADFLDREVGIPRGSYLMENGCGLNDSNRFAAAQINKLLRYMASRLDVAPDYLASLGIAGVDGTLKNRFGKTDADGNLRGKTGTLGGVTALSGYVRAAGGEKFVFSLVANDFQGRAADIRRVLDAMGAAVASLGKTPRSVAAAMAELEQHPEEDAVAAAQRRVRAYAAAPLSVAFLRTALANETDPAVRLSLAEALYQRSPKDYRSVRALLSALDLDSRQVARVQAVVRPMNLRVPGIDAAVALAAAGSADAISRLVMLAPAFEGDPDSERDLADGLTRVATAAPHGLLYALRGAAVVERLSASRLLVRQLTAGDENHPLWARVRQQRAPAAGAFRVLASFLERGLKLTGPGATDLSFSPAQAAADTDGTGDDAPTATAIAAPYGG